jgi:nucleotide-binding universal stress UspA family protein
MFKNILAAVDGTPHGDAVLDTAASLAKASGGTVHVIHVRPTQVIADGISGAAVLSVEETAEGRTVVDEGLSQDLASILVERAEELGSDLNAVGPGHYSGMSGLLHTSVSRGVARTAPVSVLLVRGAA